MLDIDDVKRLARGERTATSVHLLFNPGRASHPAARKAHGYRDDLLALQDGFGPMPMLSGTIFRIGGSASRAI